MISADMSCKVREKVPILYYDDLSPQARSVLMLIKLLDMNVQTVRVDLFKGQHLNPEFEAINPLRTVPTLVHDGLILTDSHVILMYLCEISPTEFGRVLYPRCSVKRMRLLNLLFFEVSILYRRHSEYMTDLLRNTFQGSDSNFHKKKILDAYRITEALLTNNEFLMGQSLSIADISCITTVGALDLMVPVDCCMYPRLYNWFMCMRSMSEYGINECGINRQRELMETVGQFSCGLAGQKLPSAQLGPHVTISGVFIDNDCAAPNPVMAEPQQYDCGCNNIKNCGRTTCESIRDGKYCPSPSPGQHPCMGINTICSGCENIMKTRVKETGCCSCEKTITNSNSCIRRKISGKRNGGTCRKCGHHQNCSKQSLKETLIENTQLKTSPKASILSAARQSLQQQSGSVKSSQSHKSKQSLAASTHSVVENEQPYSPTASMALALSRVRPSKHCSMYISNLSRRQSALSHRPSRMQKSIANINAVDNLRQSRVQNLVESDHGEGQSKQIRMPSLVGNANGEDEPRQSRKQSLVGSANGEDEPRQSRKQSLVGSGYGEEQSRRSRKQSLVGSANGEDQPRHSRGQSLAGRSNKEDQPRQSRAQSIAGYVKADEQQRHLTRFSEAESTYKSHH